MKCELCKSFHSGAVSSQCGNHSLKSIPGIILYYSVLPKQKMPLKVWCINNTYSNFMLFLLFLVLFVLPPMQMRWQIWVTSADRSHFIFPVVKSKSILLHRHNSVFKNCDLLEIYFELFNNFDWEVFMWKGREKGREEERKVKERDGKYIDR